MRSTLTAIAITACSVLMLLAVWGVFKAWAWRANRFERDIAGLFSALAMILVGGFAALMALWGSS